MTSFWPTVEDLSVNQAGIVFDGVDASAQNSLDRAVGLITGEGLQKIEAGTLTEVLQATGTDILQTGQIPIRSITSISIQGVTVSASLYEASTADLKAGVIHRVDRASWGWGLVTVTYLYGYVTCPRDLRDLVLGLAARHLKNPLGVVGGTGPDIQSWGALYPLELSRTEQKILARYQPTPSKTLSFPDRRRVFPR